jgi:microcompartment protein CcmK/EutM
MRLCRVLGPVWGARHVAGLDGAKLLELQPLDVPDIGRIASENVQARFRDGSTIVAVDGLRAGVGDLVLVAHGSRVRDLTVGETVADKDVVVAIVDGAALAE